MQQQILENKTKQFVSDGLVLGISYAGSPIVVADQGSALSNAPAGDVTQPAGGASPGASASAIAREVAARYGRALAEKGYGEVTTDIAPAKTFFLAEEYHQQYLTANPNGYCGIGGTGVSCPVGLF